MSKNCAAVFDIGTSSLKGGLIDKDGNVLFFSRIFFPKILTCGVWFQAFEKIFEEFSSFAFTSGIKIAGICISGNGPSIVAVGKVENRLLMWNEMPDFTLPASSSIFLPRFSLFKKLYPQDFADADLFLSCPEYLIYKLTGNAVTVLPEERYRAAYWVRQEAERFSIPYGKLPPFVSIGEKAGCYRGIPVFCGAPDFVAALIGTNTLSEGKACDRAGSSEGFNICIKEIPEKEKLTGLRLLPMPVSKLWKISFHINDSGKIFSDFMKKYKKTSDDFNLVMQEISDFVSGQGVKHKKRMQEEGAFLVKSIAAKIKNGLDILENAAGFMPEYTLSGGQAKNEIWPQMKADMTGRTFVLLKCADAELIGNAAVVFSSMKDYRSILEAAEKMTYIKKKFIPNPQ